MKEPEDILNFWFYEVERAAWFSCEAGLDARITERFLEDYECASRGEYKEWEQTPEGMLALLLLLDEFPRRMFRGTARAFELSDTAVNLAREGIVKHFDDRIDAQYKMLFYMPFLNSENLGDQRLALFYIRERAKDAAWLELAEKNYATVRRFGRFPERDAFLGRSDAGQRG
ncbi:MAG: DUF924 family protein [Alphaproteobacteria bacterium]|nr:DUF924 family protein [Alphaproteobacteria bacterium]